ncbi:Molybdopterin binding protein [Fragilariopsis cylindrus CCMP1102]|uniref:molybdopterin molybdotransferase n=1 Tax=Fragilariopsis cylindrus CCMP1102 TaxID=635003 RepID=A0A1E7FHX2_9STRA|nr:Molybdopterin binding protein [Fragilariopsis cylindrus CCMP1102]|eukprot:OEU17772.1 Molybdopterin binding protein [Fragilariopsis cylindrus CCMP1102]
MQLNNNANAPSSFVPPIPPKISFSLGVLTVSDRAFSGNYDTGDLSGPAVIETIQSILNNYNSNNDNDNTPGTTSPSTTLKMKIIETAIVQDEIKMIQDKLISWSNDDDDDAIDLIVTTGGTGFSPRDVTPEATTEILERKCDGLMSFCTLQCVSSQIQPLASLSRGTAGVRGRTLIVNLPGNPYAIKEILPILLPLSLHAVADMKKIETI